LALDVVARAHEKEGKVALYVAERSPDPHKSFINILVQQSLYNTVISKKQMDGGVHGRKTPFSLPQLNGF